MVASVFSAIQAKGISVIPSLFTFLLHISATAMIFLFSDWAWDNPGYALFLMFPTYSLINSRQIVCNFTEMKMEIVPQSIFWFTLFQHNRYSLNYLPALAQYSSGQLKDGTKLLVKEEYVVLFIFMVTLSWYMFWVYSTVTQICEYLGIKCFSIQTSKVKES